MGSKESDTTKRFCVLYVDTYYKMPLVWMCCPRGSFVVSLIFLISLLPKLSWIVIALCVSFVLFLSCIISVNIASPHPREEAFSQSLVPASRVFIMHQSRSPSHLGYLQFGLFKQLKDTPGTQILATFFYPDGCSEGKLSSGEQANTVFPGITFKNQNILHSLKLSRWSSG